MFAISLRLDSYLLYINVVFLTQVEYRSTNCILAGKQVFAIGIITLNILFGLIAYVTQHDEYRS